MASRTLTRLTAAAGTVLATSTLAVLPLAGVASAAPTDLDCPDFPDRAAAQGVLVADPSDPNRLDRDHDGQACEDHDYGGGAAVPADDIASGSPSRQVDTTPVGSVDAGDGSASAAGPAGGDGTATLVLAGFGAVAAAGAVGAVMSTRRAGRTRR